MSEVTIKWTIAAAGREVGDVETVEDTPFIEAILNMGRAVLVADEAPAPVETHAFPEPVVEANPEVTESVPVVTESDDVAEVAAE